MDITTTLRDGVFITALAGRLDNAGSREFDTQVPSDQRDTAHYVLDFREVEYISSIGIRSLVQLDRRLRARGGTMALVGLTPFVRQVLDVAGLLGSFRVAESMEAAVADAAVGMATATERRIVDGRTYTCMRQPGTSRVELWGGDGRRPAASADSLVSVPIADLGYAIGTGGFGETRRQAAAGMGGVLAGGVFAGVDSAETDPTGESASDFSMAGRSGETLVHLASAVGMSGTPPLVVQISQSELTLGTMCEDLVALAPSAGPAAGLVVLATGPRGDSTLMVGVLGDARILADGDAAASRLARWFAGAPVISGGRALVGRAVRMTATPRQELLPDPAAALAGVATLETLLDMGPLDPALPIARATAWLYSSDRVTEGVERLLSVEVASGAEWRDEWDTIARRLYRDCRRVLVAPLHGGFMGKTFRVASYDADGRQMLPTVLKISPLAVASREEYASLHYVEKFIFNNSTKVLGGATVGDWAGIRYNFLGINGPESTLTWLRHVYAERSADDVVQLFDRLFTRILKPWYGQPRWEPVPLYADHDPRRLFPDLCRHAAEELGIDVDADVLPCPELGIDLPNPFAYLQREYGRRHSETRLWYTTICHGDLNLQNVLLDERDNLYVIDFSETRPRNVVSDFARLEPIVKIEMTRLESEADLRTALRFEEAITGITTLGDTAPFRYDGDDPMIAKAYHTVTYLRRLANTVTIFETDPAPYWLAVLEWTFPMVSWAGLSPYRKRYAAYSAALIVRALQSSGSSRQRAI